MKKNEIESKIKKILTENLEIEISEEDIVGDDLISELGINSVDAISIFISIEDVFGITIDDEDLSADLISSLNKISQYIMSKMSN